MFSDVTEVDARIRHRVPTARGQGQKVEGHRHKTMSAPYFEKGLSEESTTTSRFSKPGPQFIYGPGNGSPMAMNVVLAVVLILGVKLH